MKKEKLAAFVICPFGKPNSPEKERSDSLFENVLDPILKEFNFKVIERADNDFRQGNIPSQIVEKLINSHLVLADLTDCNANVFYELGIRHSFRKPAINLILKNKTNTIPFDISHERGFEYCLDNANEIKQSKIKLKEILRNIKYNCPHLIDNPVANATDLMLLRTIEYSKIVNVITDTNEGINSLMNFINNMYIQFSGFLNSIQDKLSSRETNVTNMWTNYLGSNFDFRMKEEKCRNCGSTNIVYKEKDSLLAYSQINSSAYIYGPNPKIKKCNSCGYEETIFQSNWKSSVISDPQYD